MNRIFPLFVLFSCILLSQNSIIIKSNKFTSPNSLKNIIKSYIERTLDKTTQKIYFKESNINKFNRFIGNNHFYEIKVDSKSDLARILSELQDVPDIEYLVNNKLYKIDDFIPNDSLTSEQWTLEKIEAFGAWDITKGDPSIIVAIIDTGIDFLHPDLKNQMYINPAEDINNNNMLDQGDLDGIDNDENGFVDDVSGWDFVDKFLESDSLVEGDFFDWDNNPMDENDHGTAMAGILGAESMF